LTIISKNVVAVMQCRGSWGRVYAVAFPSKEFIGKNWLNLGKIVEKLKWNLSKS